MNHHSNSDRVSLPQAFLAYCASATTATIAFATIQGWLFMPFHQVLVLFGLGWLVAFLIPAIPYFVAIAYARQLPAIPWWYFPGGGLLTAALICVLHADLARDGPALGPIPDPAPTLVEAYLQFAPSYWSSGLMAGIVCWLILRSATAERQPQHSNSP
jgi:hypothetical protein